MLLNSQCYGQSPVLLPDYQGAASAPVLPAELGSKTGAGFLPGVEQVYLLVWRLLGHVSSFWDLHG